jgi:hypothetical protein
VALSTFFHNSSSNTLEKEENRQIKLKIHTIAVLDLLLPNNMPLAKFREADFNNIFYEKVLKKSFILAFVRGF